MNALLIGCGSKTGLDILTSLLDKGYTVYSISGSAAPVQHNKLKHLQINWKSLTILDIADFLKGLPNLDLVYFNQNSSSLSRDSFEHVDDVWRLESDWMQSHFISCILPYHIIQTLGTRCNAQTKVIWMLSSFIYNHSKQENIAYADYNANKYQNYLIMRNFSFYHDACFFGIDPGDILANDRTNLLENIINTSTTELNGTVRYVNFDLNYNFKIFNNDTTPVPFTINKFVDSPVKPEVCPVKLTFDVSTVNNESMSLTINDRVFNNLPDGKLEVITDITFPSKLEITLSGKKEFDSIIENDVIVKDKCIVLTDISIYDVNVDPNYLMRFVHLHTGDQIITSNYWGFNGTAIIDFNQPSAFSWLQHTKKKLEIT